ncbi:hypothetical protein B0H19DRAFT_1202177 [Mycena capillaripes]|nr:hypothetical protein B0H19DRAFT_1202177 [Mycena capillaripes]
MRHPMDLRDPEPTPSSERALLPLGGSASPERLAGASMAPSHRLFSLPTAAGAAHFHIHVSLIQMNDTPMRGTRRRRAAETVMQTWVQGGGAVDVSMKSRERVHVEGACTTIHTCDPPHGPRSATLRAASQKRRHPLHYASVETGRAYVSTSAERAGTSKEAGEHAERGPSAERSVSTSSSCVPGRTHQAGDGEQEVVMFPYLRCLKLLREQAGSEDDGGDGGGGPKVSMPCAR